MQQYNKLERWKLARCWLGIVGTIVAAGCTEPEREDLSATEAEVNGTVEVDATCGNYNAPAAITLGAMHARIAAVSPGVQGCVRLAWQRYINVGSRINIGPRVACAGDPTPNTPDTVFPFTRTPKNLAITCANVESGGEGGHSGGQNSTHEWFSLGTVLQPFWGTAPVWPCSFQSSPGCKQGREYAAIADTIEHEVMHDYGYNHYEFANAQQGEFDCGNPATRISKYSGSVPYIVGQCINAVLSASSEACPKTFCSDGLNMIETLDENGNPPLIPSCSCVADPQRVIEGHGFAAIGSAHVNQWSNVAAVSRWPGTIDLFAIGHDGNVYRNDWTPQRTWLASDWQRTGVQPMTFPSPGRVTVVSRFGGLVDLFAVGNDGGIYSTWDHPNTTFQQHPWFRIGTLEAVPGSQVTAVARVGDELALFVTGKDTRIYGTYWNPTVGWSQGWSQVTTGYAKPGTPIAAVARHSAVIDLFVVGTDGRVYSSVGLPTSGWAPWFPVGPPAATRPGNAVTVVARSPESLDLFIAGNDRGVYTLGWRAASNWSQQYARVGTVVTGDHEFITAVARSTSEIELFTAASDGRVWNTSLNPQQVWTPWRQLERRFFTLEVAAVQRGANQIDLFGVDLLNQSISGSW